MLHHFVIVKLNSGHIKIWKSYDDGHVWGSPAYTVLGYADTFAEAKKIRKGGKEI